MLRLVRRLAEEVARFEAAPPGEPAERIKQIDAFARCGRNIVACEAAALRALRALDGISKSNPARGPEDEDGEAMRDEDFTEDQLARLRVELEQTIAEYSGRPETKGAAGRRPGAAPLSPADPGDARRASAAAAP